MKNKIFIDFDGVIFDTEDRIQKMKKEKDELSWDEFVKQIDWEQLLQEAKPINNSIEIIKKAYDNGVDISILTKITSMPEMKLKIDRLRSLEVYTPVIFTPPKLEKADVYIPCANDILIDDQLRNLDYWSNKGGIGIYFTDKDLNDKYMSMSSLQFLLNK